MNSRTLAASLALLCCFSCCVSANDVSAPTTAGQSQATIARRYTTRNVANRPYVTGYRAYPTPMRGRRYSYYRPGYLQPRYFYYTRPSRGVYYTYGRPYFYGRPYGTRITVGVGPYFWFDYCR